MNKQLRAHFDQQLAVVIKELPPALLELVEEATVFVEDYPSVDVLRRLGGERARICGLFTGIPLTEKSVEHSGVVSDVLWLFREGILGASSWHARRDLEELRRQIRITLLHELGHHFGLDEDDLARLGYA